MAGDLGTCSLGDLLGVQGELLSDVDLWLSLELDVLLDLLGLSRGDVAPLLPVGGGEPLGLPGGGEAVPGAPN